MTLRTSKTLLVLGVAVYYSLVVFNNLTDCGSNYEFVRHVLMMDSTFPGNRGMWRAINSPTIHAIFYVVIIAWELAATAVCWWGGVSLAMALRGSTEAFLRARRLSILGLTAGLLLWLVAFLAVGGEWFLMWQSKVWNGQESAFRMFAVTGIVLLLVALPDADEQPRGTR